MNRVLKTLRPVINIIFPSLLFFAAYKWFSLPVALVLSVAYGLGSLLYKVFQKKRPSNTQMIGVTGSVLSAVGVIFTSRPKLYYLPALIKNLVVLALMGVLTVKRKSILHFMAKDFSIKGLNRVREEEVLLLNWVGMGFFLLKILSKGLGILYLDFDKLYWLVFLLGDPATIVVIGFSYLYIRKKVMGAPKDGAEETPKTKEETA